jgi:hypothetical protein
VRPPRAAGSDEGGDGLDWATDVLAGSRSATLITGGTVPNPKTHAEGETQGSGIENGETRTIAKGDVINIPAGRPHQVVIAPGGEFSAIVVKVKE